MTLLEAKQSLSRKLGINYSDIANNDVFSETDLEEYINTACYLAWDVTFWDWSEHSKTATLTSTNITNGYVSYPNDIQPSSIYYLAINGKEQKKKNFAGFKRFFEANPSGQDKFWAELKRLIFINTNYATAGMVIDIYGKKNFERIEDDTDVLPFSPDVTAGAEQFSGNDAIIILAYAQALSSEKMKNPTQGAVEEKRAYGIFQLLKSQLEQGRAIEDPINTPMFQVPDYFRMSFGSTTNGTFSITN